MPTFAERVKQSKSGAWRRWGVTWTEERPMAAYLLFWSMFGFFWCLIGGVVVWATNFERWAMNTEICLIGLTIMCWKTLEYYGRVDRAVIFYANGRVSSPKRLAFQKRRKWRRRIDSLSTFEIMPWGGNEHGVALYTVDGDTIYIARGLWLTQARKLAVQLNIQLREVREHRAAGGPMNDPRGWKGAFEGLEPLFNVGANHPTSVDNHCFVPPDFEEARPSPVALLGKPQS